MYQLHANEKVERSSVNMILRLAQYASENEEDRDTFVFTVRYVYRVSLRQNKTLLPLSLAITGLPRRYTAIACVIVPDISDRLTHLSRTDYLSTIERHY